MQQIHFWSALATVLFLTGPLAAQEADEESPEDALTRQRQELMLEFIGSIRCSSEDADFPDRFEEEPIFRYTDPARQYVGAALWRLGAEGRPLAIISTELHRDYHGRPRIVFEYLSLSETPFSASSSRGISWRPEESYLEFEPIPESPAPAETPERRLIQMRSMTRKFEANETLGAEVYTLRLLSSPILRYQESEVDRADGAIFLFAYGTNPEIALFIESDGEEWSFAAGRLSGARASLKHGEDLIWRGPPVEYGWGQPYNASNLAADIPGVEP